MRAAYFTLLIVCFSALFSPSVLSQTPPNVLIVDSSFPPIKAQGLNIKPSDSCFWMSEFPSVTLPTQGECYDSEQWADVSAPDQVRLEGLLDFLSGRVTDRAKEWSALEGSHPNEAQKIKGNFLLAVHGARSTFLVSHASGGKARPLLMRSLSSQVGSLKSKDQNSSDKSPKATQLARYKNGCTLVNWTPSQDTDLRNHSLFEYQERIASLLRQNPSIRVVNLSLGYKEDWIQSDSSNCTSPQVHREFELLQSTWSRLFKSFPNHVFVVAAGNEAENFDRSDLLTRDLWASLVDSENLLLVGAMRSDGRRLSSSNYGLAVEAFALGDNIPSRTPFPGVELGIETLISGTSFAAPLVSGQLLSLFLSQPKLTAAEAKRRVLENLSKTRKELIFKSFEKYCKGKNHLNECLDVVSDLISRPLLWRPTFELYLQGRNAWGFRPIALQFQEDLQVLGQTKLMFLENNLTPALLLKPTDNPWELLITLHHELFHFASMDEAAKQFSIPEKIKNCVTPYQLALLRDELPAYLEELEFYKASPKWFKEKLGNKRIKSLLFGRSLNYKDFYKQLDAELKKNSQFIYQKYVELGHYPECVLDLVSKTEQPQ